MNTEDTLERSENRVSFLSNKVLEHGKTQQHIKENAENTKKALQAHLEQAKETFIRTLDQSFERLCMTIDETVQKDIENLEELEENLNRDIEKMKALVEEVKANGKQMNLQQVNQNISDIGKSNPELPMISLSFSTKINESAMSVVEDKSRDLLKLNMTGSVQIIECLERPGAITVRWDEQPVSDCESVATDTSTISEYILQATTKHDNVFYTIYEGDNMEYTMSFAEPNNTYRFRVCQYMSNSSGGGLSGAWSVVKTATTSLSPHVWCEADCVTDSDLQLYQLSNGRRTATKIFPESSRILRSKEPSYRLGQQLTFWIEETGDGSSKDGIGLICGNKQADKHLTESANTTVMTSKGTIFVNGTRMTTKLPVLKKNSVVVFQASRLMNSTANGGKFRVSISVDDKEVTFDWSTSAHENDALFFGCAFEHTGWQLSVG